MQKVFVFCVCLFLFSDIKSDSLYDSLGNYLGKTEDNGSMFDSLGGYQGRVDSNGSIYNSISGRLKTMDTLMIHLVDTKEELMDMEICMIH